MSSNEWYTPAVYIEAARTVMGSIDLDPASCALANQTVRATHYYNQEDDGLAHAWYGNVWLNPPYSSSKSVSGLGKPKQKGPTHLFVEKLHHDFHHGDVTQAIVCVNADFCRPWFQCLWEYILCFHHRPVHFNKPNADGVITKDSRNSHFFGSCFIYLGPHEDRFIEIFSQFGIIAKAVNTEVFKRKVDSPQALMLAYS